MAWVYLIAAGVFEIGLAVGLKLSMGFSRLAPTLTTIACVIASMALLGLAVRTLPIGIAYAIWTAIGTAGTALVGVLALGEAITAAKIGCIGLILVGTTGLHILSE